MKAAPLDAILSHWSKLFEGLDASSEQFYESVKEGLKRRRLPDARIRRIEWTEGGALSPNREYLRIDGSGFRFDLCAAPFGTGYFFSWWLTAKPAEMVWLYLLLFAAGAWKISGLITWLIQDLFRQGSGFNVVTYALQILFQSPLVIGAMSVFAAMVVVAFLSRVGLLGPEEALLTVPVLGWVHQTLFAPVTFYRLDTASMFRATVHQAVLEALDDLTTQRGHKALAPEERKPTLDRLG